MFSLQKSNSANLNPTTARLLATAMQCGQVPCQTHAPPADLYQRVGGSSEPPRTHPAYGPASPFLPQSSVRKGGEGRKGGGVFSRAYGIYKEMQNIRNVKRCRNCMPKVCKQGRDEVKMKENIRTKPHRYIIFTLESNCSVKICRDEALYIFLHFYIIPTLFVSESR